MNRPVTSETGQRIPASSAGGPDDPVAVLTLLNRTLVALVAEGEPAAPLGRLLRDACTLTGAASMALYRNAEGGEAVLIARTPSARCDTMAACLDRFRDGGSGSCEVRPLLSDGITHGWLVSEPPRHAAVSDPLVPAHLADGLAGVLAGCARAQRQRRNRIREERAAIARELHDSLAQSLSYLKIQASRLHNAVNGAERAPGRDAELMNEIVGELRRNLNVAYRQLRELITTFRLTMNGRTLSQALEESVDEFQRRSGIVFEVDDRLSGDELEAHEEIQVLQIAREALSNIVRHSHARHARLILRQEPGGELVLGVEDDGVGLETAGNGERHHGLVIMQERARDLRGTFRAEPAASGGTRVQVRFLPRALAGRELRP